MLSEGNWVGPKEILVWEDGSHMRQDKFVQLGALRIVFFSKHYWGSEMKKDEIAEASWTNGEMWYRGAVA